MRFHQTLDRIIVTHRGRTKTRSRRMRSLIAKAALSRSTCWSTCYLIVCAGFAAPSPSMVFGWWTRLSARI